MKLILLNHRISGIVCRILLLIITGVYFTSCTDDNYDLNKRSNAFEYNPSLALTIGSTTIKLDDLLNELDSSQYIHQVNTGADSGMFYVIYEEDLNFYKGEDKFSIPGTNSANYQYNVPAAVFPPSGEIRYSVTYNFPVDFGADQRIDSMHVKQMLMDFTINSTLPQLDSLKITFPNLTLNNVPLSDSVHVTSASTQMHEDAGGYFLKFASASLGSSNLAIKLDIKLTGTPLSPFGPGSLGVIFFMDTVKYYAMYGFAGRKNLLDISDSIYLTLLNRNLTNTIEWADPRLTLSIKNSYVVLPIRFSLSDMATYSQIKNKVDSITLDPSINPYNLLYPTNLGGVAENTIEYNKQNSTIFQAIEGMPEYVKFHADAFCNPDGDSGEENMIVDTSSVKVTASFYLPIWFRAGNFGTYDTMDFDLNDAMGNDLDSIESMLFRIISENGMPINLRLQVYFADSSLNILGALFDTTKTDNTIMVGGQIGTDGKVVKPTRKIQDINFSSDQLAALKNTKKLLLAVYFSTTDFNKTNPGISPYVKFFSDYKFKLTFGCQFKARLRGYF